MSETTCQQWKCTDTAEETIHLESGDQAYLCEDHAHMTIGGEPVDGYEPNDPSKFSD